MQNPQCLLCLVFSYLLYQNRYTNWSRPCSATDSDDGAAFSTSTIAFESIRRFHSAGAMTATKVAHVIKATAFLSVKVPGQCVSFVKRPRSSTCRHPLWRAELPPSEVEVGHRGGRSSGRIQRIRRLKLDDWKLKSIDVLVWKLAFCVWTVW